MITQIVMILSIICLFWAGIKISKRSKKNNFISGRFLAWGLFFVGISIIFYAIRDVFIQLGFSNIEIILYRSGGVFQALGAFALIYFVFREFSSKRLTKIVIPLVTLIILFLLTAILFLPMKSIIKEAPLEPITYKVISHPWELKIVNFAFLGSILLFSTIIFFIFLFNVLRQQNQKMKIKGFLYGTGILLLFAPAILCVFISPIFARIGYVLGAALIYKAFDMKV